MKPEDRHPFEETMRQFKPGLSTEDLPIREIARHHRRRAGKEERRTQFWGIIAVAASLLLCATILLTIVLVPVGIGLK